MSRFPFSSRAPRRGQALLLAVLIMIFAALLSASFLVVVSVNLNQTARQTDKNRASVAAQAGLSQISQQLAYSPEGDRWRSELENVPPAPGDASYSFYYTPMEIAQGWARVEPHTIIDWNKNGRVYDGSNPNTVDPGDEKVVLDMRRATGKLELVKSPDPRGTGGQINEAPSFLSQVERVPNSANPDIAGALKITVIGLSSEDPTAFSRVVAYKGGFRRSPIGQVMRTVSNWDFKNNVVPAAVANVAAATNTVTITQANSDFSQIPLPFPVTMSNPTQGIAAHSTLITKVVTPAVNAMMTPIPNSHVLTTIAPVTTVQGERVELAANLGSPTGINYSNSATPTPVPLNNVHISDTDFDLDSTKTPGANQVDGARVNGGLIYSGNLNAARLRALADSYGRSISMMNPNPLVPGTVGASGVIAPDTASVTAINFANSMGTADTLKASDNTAEGIFASANVANRAQLVSDGWNNKKGVPSANNTTRSVPEFVPPSFSTGEGLNRYRNQARFSAPAAGYTVGGNKAAQNGYGQGIYIDNAQDRERIYDTATSKYRDMTQAELIQMWLSKVSETVPPAATNFMRTDIPLTLAVPGSLEQKHLRGWVGPDEFRARGVEIELGNGVVTITRDARDDANPLGASPNQAWKQPDGTVGADNNARYTRILPWPTTGVIFAEGNVRIKGNATNAPNSLTVVSMGNIYIDDSLSIDDATDGINVGNPRKILLMPKKNGILNPTRVMGRPDAETLTPVTSSQTVTAGTPTTLKVVDAAAFRKGDFIQTSTVTGTTETISTQGYVTADPVAPFDQLSIRPTTPTTPMTSVTVTGASIVRTPLGTNQLVPTSIATRTVPASAITSTFDAIQRRLFLPAELFSTTPMSNQVDMKNVRLAFNHQADRISAFKVGIKKVGTDPLPPNGVYFSNKGVLFTPPPPYFNVNAAVVAQGDKKLRVQYTEPATATDDFPITAPTNETEANDIDRNLGDNATTGISATMNSTARPGIPAGSPGFQYDVTVTPGNEKIPFFYLAGVGNRYSSGSAPTVDTRQNLNPTTGPTPYLVPLANSIGLNFNGSNIPVYDEHFNTALTTPNYDQTKQFGFNQMFTDSMTPPVIPSEDVLTSDQGFYQTDGFQSTLDSRSPYNADPMVMASALVPGVNNSLVLRQTDGLVQPVAPAKFPDYRLIDAKLENVALTTDTAGNVKTTSIGTGYTFNVNAYVYAQTGSWFVIPGGMFDERLRGDETQTYLDINQSGVADTGEFAKGVNAMGVQNTAPTWEVGDYADLNRDGIIQETEKHAMTRYSRFNYQINFIGAIAENQTALVNTIYDATGKIVQPGAVSDWMTKWATTNYTVPAMGPPTLTNDRIHYVFDPTVALNAFQVGDEGFKLPQTTDLFYQD